MLQENYCFLQDIKYRKKYLKNTGKNINFYRKKSTGYFLISTTCLSCSSGSLKAFDGS